MQLISPTDSMFLLVESREHAMHVGALQLFQPPEGADADFVRQAWESMVAQDDVQPTWRKHPARIWGGITNLAWSFDEEVDFEYHLRRSALPRPGRVRELLELASRLHGSLLDRHRPLWEAHLIEGLADGRFALYTKYHHSLLDGVSGAKLLIKSLTNDPEDMESRVPWTIKPRPRAQTGQSSRIKQLTRTAGALAELAPSTVTLARAALLEQQLTLPFRAPKTMFNVSIGGARRVAAQTWSLERIRAVKSAAGTTVNDVVLAMCAGALRIYLQEQDALPATPLVAMVPVNMRKEGDGDGGGNLVGALLCNLATHLDDPAARLAAISASMRDNKKVFGELPRTQALAVSAFNIAALGLGAVPGFVSSTPPPFNLVISNVPGSQDTLYWKGARLDGSYPLSIALDGQALNITLSTRGENLDFGLVGARREVPSMQRLLGHLEQSIKDLEQAVGL